MLIVKRVEVKEQKLQEKILKDLKSSDIWHFKTIRSNRNGIPDIVGMCKNGRFFAIEVKSKNGKLTELQKFELNTIRENNGICAICYSFDDYLIVKDVILRESRKFVFNEAK